MRLSTFIQTTFGIQMPPSKKILLQTRLQKRALQLGYASLHEYIDYLFSAEGQNVELDQFSTIISTHKTDFFREPDHFSILHTMLLPELLAGGCLGIREPLVAWSSASSTGEEVYSIAMSIVNHFRVNGNSAPLLKVIGTDISEDIVAFARKGIYSDQAIASIPQELRSLVMRSKDTERHAIRIVPEVRVFTDFRRQNLMDQQYRVKRGIHLIFCRNVLIYFDKNNQEMILRKLVDLMAIGGFLLIGHSETLSGINLPLEQVRVTVYRKTGESL